MQDPIINQGIKRGILYGCVAAILLYFYIAALITSDLNTVYAQLFGKLIFIGFIVLYGFYSLKRDYQNDFKLFPAVLMGVVAGITTAIVSTGFELVSIQFGVLLKPEEFAYMDIPQFVLSVLFSVEMVGYSLIASLIGIQYHKKEHRKRAVQEAAEQ